MQRNVYVEIVFICVQTETLIKTMLRHAANMQQQKLLCQKKATLPWSSVECTLVFSYPSILQHRTLSCSNSYRTALNLYFLHNCNWKAWTLWLSWLCHRTRQSNSCLLWTRKRWQLFERTCKIFARTGKWHLQPKTSFLWTLPRTCSSTWKKHEMLDLWKRIKRWGWACSWPLSLRWSISRVGASTL